MISSKTIVTAFAAALLLGAAPPAKQGAAPAKAPAAELAGMVSLAPFSDLSAKTTSFGMLIGNPIVPTLLLATMQQSVVATYGNFRTDSPFYMAVYSDASGVRQDAVVFPAVNRIAHTALANPGSEKIGGDTLHLVPNDAHPEDRYAVFSADGRYVSFASSAGLARRALADCRAHPEAKPPLARATLHRAGVEALCEAGREAGVTNVIGILKGFSRLDVSFDLGQGGLVLAFGGRFRATAQGKAVQARLERELKDSFRGFGEGDAGLAPSVKVSVADSGEVSGEVRLSEDQIRGLGKDFNSFVAAQMSGALSGGENTGTKGAKGEGSGK